MCGTVSFFVEKKQSPLLHCVCGEAQVLQKEAVSYKKKRLGQKLSQVQYHRALVLQCETAIRLLPSNKIECPG
jgi:hypothetical protein